MITENLSTLKIHKLTQDQYEREVREDRIEANAFYLTPDAGHMIITIDGDKASHTAIEISNHVQTGGTVVLYDGDCNYFHLKFLSDREVFFSSTQGYSGQDIGYWIFGDGTVESRKIPTPTMIVTIDAVNETASHSFSEIKAHVEAGGTAVATDGGNYYSLNLLGSNYVNFTVVLNDAYIYEYTIYSDDTVEYRYIGLVTHNEFIPTMIVEADGETFSRSFREIEDHANAGGMVIVKDYRDIFQLTNLDDERAIFISINTESSKMFLREYILYSDDTISFRAIQDEFTPTMIVTLNTTKETASHSFGEIKAHVENGGTVVARVDSSDNRLYYLDHLDDTAGVATFTCVGSDSTLYILRVGHDEGYDLSSVNLIMHVDSTVTKSSTNAVQSKAVYDYVQTAYKAVGTNLIAPITQRLDNASIDELITVEDIDTICGATITYVNLDEGAF